MRRTRPERTSLANEPALSLRGSRLKAKATLERSGDSHNFGRRVTVGARTVRKPRTLLWEWLLLARESPLRRLLDERASGDGLGGDAFGFLPDLRFRNVSTPDRGEVEKVRLAPLRRSRANARKLAEVVGRSLSLWSFLGVADLHWENLALGVDAGGRIVFAPLDLEMILDDLALPTETKLIPDAEPEYAEICRHACGVRRALPYLGKPLAISELLSLASSYRVTLEFLERHSRAIAEVFSALPSLSETPIRVLLRGTGDYVRASAEPLFPPLLDAEREQLERGDIPYFFRFYGRAGIHYYGDPELRVLRRLPLRGDVPRLEPLLQLSRGSMSPKRASLKREGLLCVLGAFDHPSFTGKHSLGGFEVVFGARSLVVTLPDGEQFRARRDLSAYVGSVYLPCRCGEVRSVFVPSRTRCDGLRSPA